MKQYPKTMSPKWVVFFCCMLVALAEVSEKDVVPIVHQESDIEPDGHFHWNYEGGDGSKADQEGSIKEVDQQQEQVVKGSWEYTDADGKVHKTEYEADGTGFHAYGDDIPPIPPLIQKSLDYLASLPPEKESKN